jgi:beta-N-acetylhexosaminidase
MVGFAGREPSAALRALAREGDLGGVILFDRNLGTLEELVALVGALRALWPDSPPLIAVDQEGGPVARLGPPFTPMPAARRLGQVGSADLAFRCGAVVGRELRAAGLAMNLAPVLDVDTNPANPVIGPRAFGPDPDLVARLGGAVARGLEAAGIAAAGKHFPGHGDTSRDSHRELPRVAHDRARLAAVELHPFREAIRAGLPVVMTGHLLVPALDPDRPATVSRAILTGLLRGELGFEGVVISDDLEMRGIADGWAVPDAAVEFLAAGGDLALICADAEGQRAAIGAVRRAIATGRLATSRIGESLARVGRLKARYVPREPPTLAEARRVIGCAEHRRVAEAVGTAGAGGQGSAPGEERPVPRGG